MRNTHAQLLPGAMSWLVLVVTLASVAFTLGLNVAHPPAAEKEPPPGAGVLQEPAQLGDGPLLPVTAEHQGRLLVLTYGPKPGAGGLASPISPRGEPPRFAVYQGQRQIASGQFEYG